MKKKKSLQELILNMLSGKKAMKQKNLAKEIEIIVEQSENDYCGKTKPKYAINRVLKKMIDDDVLEQRETEFSSFLSLSKAGSHKLRNIKLSSQNHLVNTQWDGFWRIVMLDIPDTRKSERDAVRYILKKAQFVQLKASVWISPFPMEHMMIGMKNDLDLHDELMVFVTDTMDTETERILTEKFTSEKKES